MTADGIWRGGTRPFGYKLTHNGRIGKKNRPLYDLSIDEVEGPIVKEVFDLIIHEGYGTLRAANYLNDKYASLGKNLDGADHSQHAAECYLYRTDAHERYHIRSQRSPPYHIG